MNKQKKLKLILSSFKQKQLIKFFQTFLDTIKCKFYKSIKQISFSCYQSTCQVQNFMVNGYGKTSSQALLSGINNLIDCLIQEQQYCEIMRNCLRKFNVTPYGLNDNGTASKKQLLSTQKALKTVGPQISMSLQKKVLTMSANLSSNSKDSSSKGKSIKQQIFQYFNLQNLKVKNPNQQFSTVSPMAANTIKNKKPGLSIQNQMILSQSKQKYIVKQPQYQQHQLQNQQKTSLSNQDKQLELVFQRIRQVQQKIQLKEKQNRKIKQQITKKKKNIPLKQSNQNFKNHPNCNQNVLININKVNTQPPVQNYFTRPSLQKNSKKPTNILSTTQSNKKISYLEMSLNQKLNQKEKENFKSMMTNNLVNSVHSVNYNKAPEQPPTNYINHHQQQQTNEKSNTTDNHFQKIDLIYSKNHKQKSTKTQQNVQRQKQSLSKWNTKQNYPQISKSNNDQRKCLVDISNFSHNQHQKLMKSNQYSTFNVQGSFKNPSSTNSSAFQTINGNYHNDNSHHPNVQLANSILYSKVSQQNQESLSIIQSSKKLRSLSVQNSLAQKVNNNTSSYGTKNPMTIISGGKLNNTSFDNGSINLCSSVGLGLQNQKKIKIPKLNLQILPNYHGKSNKSLNQSLMQIYQKKNQPVTPFNQ